MINTKTKSTTNDNIKEDVSFDTISNYWQDRHPGRMVGGSTPDENTEEFFKKVDDYRYHENHYKYLLEGEAEFDQHKGEKLLEIGCGLGADLGNFATGGAIVHAIDATSSPTETLPKRFDLIQKKFEFKQADFRDIPYPDNYFDVVYSFGVLHHSPWIADGVSEINRVLKPGGKIIIMLYYKGFKYYIRKLFWQGIIKGQFLKYTTQQILNKNTEEFGGSPTTLVYNRKEAQDLFSPYFNQIKMEVYRFDDYLKLPLKKRIYVFRAFLPKSWYRKCESLFGWNLIIKAHKQGS